MSNTTDFKVKNGLSVGTSITAIGSLTTAGQTFPAADGSTGQYLKTNGSGALSWGTVSTSLNITDGTTTDTVGLTETVTFTGGTNITLAVTDNTITINNDHVNSSDITENTNLFFTDARAIAAVQGAADLTIDGGTIYVDTSANRVGIVDTSPQQTLDVGGNIGVNGNEVINSSSQIVGAVLDSAMTVGGSLAGVLSNLKIQYGTSYSGTPIQGSFFFDSLNQKLKVYTGSAFVDAVPASGGGGGGGGSSDANTTFRNYSYTLTGTSNSVTGVDDNEIDAGAFIIGHKYTITTVGNTSFTGIGASGNTVGVVFIATGVGTGTGKAKQTLFYDTTSSSTRVVAYVNGIKQVYGSGRDFVATTGTSVAFTYNLGSGDTIDIQVYELLTNAAYYLKSEVYTQAVVNSQIATGVSAYLPLAGGAMTGAITTNSTFDGVDIATRDGVLTTTTVKANVAVRTDGTQLETTHNIWGKVKNTSTATSAYSELQIKNNADESLVLGSIGSNYTDSTSWAGARYIYSTAGDLYLKSAANLKLFAGGHNIASNLAMTILANKNVGIGTASPQRQLVLYSPTASGQTNIQFQNSTTGAASGDGFGVGMDAAEKGFIWNYESNDTYIGGTTGGTSITVAGSNGKVGIGTNSPSGVLSVSGVGTSTSPNIAITSTNSDSFNHAINAFNPNLTAGEQQLIVVGKAGSTKNAGYMGYVWNGAGYDANLLTFGHWASDNLMNLRADGKLGIGTSTPSEKLTITNGSINLQSNNSYIKGAGHNVLQVDATRTYFYGGTSGVQFRTADNANDLVSISNGGQVSMHGTGTEAYIGRLALNVSSTTADGLYVRNSSGGGNFDLVALGSGYNSHGVSPNDTWLYSANDINIGGASGGSNNVQIVGNGAIRMGVSSAGIVTTPYQPAFRANASSGTTYAAGWQQVTYTNSVTTRGPTGSTGYNSANSRFTAPVNGWYQFNAQWNANTNTDNDGTMSLWINNSASNLAGSSSMPNTGPNYEGHVVSGACYLAANDWVTVHRYASVSNTTRGSAPYGGWFSGFLVG